MKTAKEFLEDKEQKIIKTVGLKDWEDNKVYFPYEVINFMEEYAAQFKTRKIRFYNIWKRY